MKRTKKQAELELSQHRTKVLAPVRKRAEEAGNNVSEELLKELREAKDKDDALMRAHEVFLLSEVEEERVAPPSAEGISPEVREIMAIENRVSPAAAILQAIGVEPAEGAEKELREAFEITDPSLLPFSVFDQTPAERAELDRIDKLAKRQDVTVATPATIGSYQNTIIQRIFSPSVLTRMGARMRMVPVGDQVHMVITAGASPEFAAKDNAPHYSAATITPTTTTPKRLTTSYRFAVQDLLRVKGLETTLRSDLARALSNRVDVEVLHGSNAAGIQGFLNNAVLAAPGRGAGPTETFDTAVAELTEAIDGLYALGAGQVMGVVNPATSRHMERTFRGDTEMSVADWLRSRGGGMATSANMPAGTRRVAQTTGRTTGGTNHAGNVSISVATAPDTDLGYRAGDHVTFATAVGVYRITNRPDASTMEIARVDDGSEGGLASSVAAGSVITRAATRYNDVLLAKTGPGAPDNIAFDVWQGVRVTRDNITGLKEGNIALVFDMFHDFKVLRSDGFVRANYAA